MESVTARITQKEKTVKSVKWGTMTHPGDLPQLMTHLNVEVGISVEYYYYRTNNNYNNNNLSSLFFI